VQLRPTAMIGVRSRRPIAGTTGYSQPVKSGAALSFAKAAWLSCRHVHFI